MCGRLHHLPQGWVALGALEQLELDIRHASRQVSPAQTITGSSKCCVLHLQAYAPHKKAPSRSLRIYVQELPVTMNLVWPVVLRDGYFWYGECRGSRAAFAVVD